MQHLVRGIIAALFVLAGLSMLTRSEAAGLNIHGVNPQLRASIGSLSGNRPVILARAAPALYNSGGTITALSYTAAGYELGTGDLLRISLWGLVINNTAGNLTLNCSAAGTNALGGAGFNMGGGTGLTITPAGGNPNLYQFWRCDFLYAIAPPGATQIAQNYQPQIGALPVTNGNTYSSGLQPLNNFGFYGGGWLFGTDSVLSGAVVSGGRMLTGVGGSGALSMKTPVICDNSVPTRIDINVTSASATFPITVLGGYIEGM
jgi:hypothetical protein